MGRRLRWSAAAALVCLAAAGSAAAAPLPAPGYSLDAHAELARGVEHFKLVRGGSPQVVNVARVARDAPYDLRAVPANGGIGQGLERTSSMCRRVSCLVAVNGDFWDPATAGIPAGAVISLGSVLRSPSSRHDQMAWSPDGGLFAGRMRLDGSLVTDDLEPLPITTLNTHLNDGDIGVYTPAWGHRTGGSPQFGITLEKVRPSGPFRLGTTALVRFQRARRGGEQTIPRDGLVLAGRGNGAAKLTKLWAQIRKGKKQTEALLRVQSTPAAVESVGGYPVLIRDGRSVLTDESTSLVRGRHPRTLVGRTAAGDVLLVTVDGRQPGYSDGMTLAEATNLMLDLGAVEAMNLDGGGSSTFVVRGDVINQPSDRAVVNRGHRGVVHAPGGGDKVLGLVERPVATSLELVPRTKSAAPPKGTGVLASIHISDEQVAAAPYATDPGSDPTGKLPAIVVPMAAERSIVWWSLALVFAILAIAFAALSHPKVRRIVPAH